MALYVALCYYDRDQPWDGVPDKESTPEYTEFARRATEAGVMRGGEALHPVTMSTTITVSGGKGGDVLVTDTALTPRRRRSWPGTSCWRRLTLTRPSRGRRRSRLPGGGRSSFAR